MNGGEKTSEQLTSKLAKCHRLNSQFLKINYKDEHKPKKSFKNGKRLRWKSNEKLYLYQQTKAIGMLLNYKCAEDQLADEKERLAVTLKSINEGVITTDVYGNIVLINKVAEELTGWTQQEAASRPLDEVFHIKDEITNQFYSNPLSKVLANRKNLQIKSHTILVDRQNREKYISDSGAYIREKNNKIIGTVIVIRDITEKLLIEKELFRANKIESIGTLAGGIAHDFNNILTVILGNISLAIMYAKNNDMQKVLDRLNDVEKASLQARDLTQQMLTFSKGGAPIKKTSSIAEIIRDTVSFCLSGSNIKTEFLIPEELWPVEIDQGQISQVLNNLIINAKQAMQNGGNITIKVKNVTIKQDTYFVLNRGKYIKIAIKDTGCGISDEYINKIFDPYFTTKTQGNGLGLTTCYSIIKNHNGYISVKSKMGKGTTFYIYLPASESKLPPKAESKCLIKGTGKILVMDDDENIRDVMGRMLEQLGYNAYFAKDGMEVINLYAKEHYDAIILDLTIRGGMGGEEAIKQLLKVYPDAKAIVSSGYSNDPIMARYKDYGFKGIVVKPYKIYELSSILNDVLKI